MNEVCCLEIAQMLKVHPVIAEKDSYKCKYINVLEYFVRKYASDETWANATLNLYKKKLLENAEDYIYVEGEIFKQSKSVGATKFRPFKFFSYRYCLLMDCILIVAMQDEKRGRYIYDEISSIYSKRYEKKLKQVFDALYNSDILLEGFSQICTMMECWKKNKKFLKQKPIKVIVTANMSAGKSTLMNALVGKKVNKTQNDACTAKIHRIVNKPYEDDLCYELDYLLDLDADYKTLMEDNSNNTSTEIVVGTFFRTLNNIGKRVWLIDTPGVNSSQDIAHKELAEKTIINTDADILIYLMNGENIGSDDDRKHLLFIQENYHGNILFVVNKLDKYRSEDSVPETLNAVKDDLRGIGFKNPTVVPVSAYAGYLAKMNLFGETLNDDEQEELEMFYRKLKKEKYQFNGFYSEQYSNIDVSENKNEQLLLHSGLLSLEKILYDERKM